MPDLEAYSWGYEQIHNTSLAELATANIYGVKIPEVGFRYLMKLCAELSSSFTFFLFILGVLWLIGYFRVISSYSPYVIISLLLLVVGPYNQSIFVIRQHLAMLVVFLSYTYIIRKNAIKFLLVIALAFLLHQTAIIVLPLYFLYQIRDKKKIIISIILVAIFLYFSFSYFLVTMGNDMLQGYSSYIDYNKYTTPDYIDSDTKTNATGAFIVALELFLYIYMLKKDVFDDGINRILLLSLVVGLILSICGIGYNPTSRLVMYYTSVSFLTIPIMAKYARSHFYRNFIALLFLFLYAYMTFAGSGFISIKDYRLALL